MSGQQFVVLVPVKPPAVGKSRLLGLDADVRRALAEAFAQDTVAACQAAGSVAQVMAVTDDVHFSTVLAALGADTIPDGVTDDLNGTLRQAAAEARRRWPHLTPVALCADLPALRSEDLDAVLSRVLLPHPSFVPDAAGTGTTLYVAGYDEFDPRFGPGSRDAHLDAGADERADVPLSVRRDVDDVDDLRAAMALGVGPRTAAVMAE
jgi:2-phospho-L-lactate guanylyltransferase